MNKISIVIGGFLLMTLNSIGQSQKNFEGEIIYQFDFISKMPKVDSKMIKNIVGSGSTLSFKQGNYRHDYDGGIVEFDIYNKEDNKAYFKKRNNDTIYWSDCSLPGNKIKNFKFASKKETILGIDCDQLIIEYEKKSEIHYYNSDSIITNPAWFKNFKTNGENLIDEKEKSIFLKSESDFDGFTMISIADKISRHKIDEKIFKIPANSILVLEE
ncbi:MAG: hypothetical protein ABI359_12150 [Ginsengibacter sp.]